MFASVHTNMALEMVYWLQKTNFAGHVYFDTFPRYLYNTKYQSQDRKSRGVLASAYPSGVVPRFAQRLICAGYGDSRDIILCPQHHTFPTPVCSQIA